MKIVNGKKFLRSIMLILGMVILFTLSLSNNVSFSEKEILYKEIYASSGDTLWSIAKEESINNTYYSDKDLRYIVKDIKKINNLDNSDLIVGQKLLVPDNQK